MSGPKMGINPKKVPPDANTSRPNGCSKLATSLAPGVLWYASAIGNRATRREAVRNLLKQARIWVKTPEGKRAMAEKIDKS